MRGGHTRRGAAIFSRRSQGGHPINGDTYRLFQTTPRIVLTAALAVLFGVRAAMSVAGISSLSGPVWTVVDVLIAIAAVIRCFDRIVITPAGITVFRVGIPKRVSADRIRELVLVKANGNWSRLYVETTDRGRALITMERRNAAGQFRMAELCDHAGAALGTSTAIAPISGPTPAAPQITSPNQPRRCVRSGCSAYLAEVTSRDCEACGGRTQRVPP